ncbi:MAG: EAL domain-containing protein [Chloroflexi bacterium]|nr:EAL domain-containing protein [Chloroflexota bacterium]
MAADEAEALELSDDQTHMLVVGDLGRGGRATAEVIDSLKRSAHPGGLPPILVTGVDGLAERVQVLRAGADDYLAGALEPEELVARIEARLRGRAALAARIENDLRARAEIALSLSRLHTDMTPEGTAAAICEELARRRELPLVAILVFTREGAAVPLALQGSPDVPWSVGSSLPARTGRTLRQRAAQGPWTQQQRSTRRHGPGRATLAELGVAATINAPLTARGDLLGLLVVGTNATDARNGDDFSLGLPAVIDFAAITAALLAPALERRLATGDQRTELAAIIATEAFTPVFQPIIELGSGRVVGYEALTRFHDGADPELRFSEAGRLGLGIELETATLRAALRASQALPPDAWLSLNVSPALILQGTTLADVIGLEQRGLMLELTEHDPVDDYALLRTALEGLGEGTRLSVDDAGSGYASLQHILALRPAYVKLNIAFVSGLHDDPARQAMVAGLRHFATQTGSELIAEGVETADERLALDQLAVRLGQGYLLGRPAALD